jgi:hypothetical protein
VWTNDVHGNYSACDMSGYNMLLKSDVGSSKVQEDWQSLWKIHVPPKAKQLLGEYVESVCQL